MICQNCGGVNNDTEKICVTCGKPLKVVPAEKKAPQKPMILPAKDKAKKVSKLIQDPAVLVTVAGILIINGVMELVLETVENALLGISGGLPNIGALIVDIVLAVNLIGGKTWARTWVLVRCFLGLLFFGAMYLTSGQILLFLAQLSYVAAISVLLFGPGSRKKAIITGSVYGLSLLIYLGLIGVGYSFIATHRSPGFTSQKYDVTLKSPSKNWMVIPENEQDRMDLKIPGQIVEVSDLSGGVIVSIIVMDPWNEDAKLAGESLHGLMTGKNQVSVTRKSDITFHDRSAFEILYSMQAGVMTVEGRLITIVSGGKAYGILVVGQKQLLPTKSEEISKILDSIKIE